MNVFREVWRVLRDDGTLWVNIGDSYSHSGRGEGGKGIHSSKQVTSRGSYFDNNSLDRRTLVNDGLAPKQLIGIPWRLAFALQEDGWYLRSDIIWHKPNPMPESVTDRPTKAHEYIFLLAKQEHYFYDAEATKEPASIESAARLLRGVSAENKNVNGAPGQTPHSMNQPRENKRNARDSFKRDGSKRENPIVGQGKGTHRKDREESSYDTGSRNKRTVWTVAPSGYKGAHFATFPPALIEPCILAGSRPGDIVLDPFSGSGTTGVVCIKHQRRYVGLELNPDYIKLSHQRVNGTQIAMVDLLAPP